MARSHTTSGEIRDERRDGFAHGTRRHKLGLRGTEHPGHELAGDTLSAALPPWANTTSIVALTAFGHPDARRSVLRFGARGGDSSAEASAINRSPAASRSQAGLEDAIKARPRLTRHGPHQHITLIRAGRENGRPGLENGSGDLENSSGSID